MSDRKKIVAELRELGYHPFCFDSSEGQVVCISYCIPTGIYQGKTVSLGFSFQESGYPEYPPHWIHISPPYNDEFGGSVKSYQRTNKEGIESQWLALSRPPGNIWDDLPTKHMRYYLDYHIARFCKDLK